MLPVLVIFSGVVVWRVMNINKVQIDLDDKSLDIAIHNFFLMRDITLLSCILKRLRRKLTINLLQSIDIKAR